MDINDILVRGHTEKVERMREIINKRVPNNLGEVEWYIGCAK